jgi:peptidoglycan/xylan/chitin deacetylase (PgdA/CDA1 family)
MGPSEQRAAIQDLQEAVQVALPSRPTSAYRAATWDQARALDPQLIDIGSHTCTHPVLSRCTDDEIAHEVVASRRTLAAQLRRIPDAFCYPNGQTEDYDARCLRAVRRAGYTSATVAHGGTVGADTDPYAIERMAAPASVPDFRRAIDGVTQLADQWRAWRPGKTS